ITGTSPAHDTRLSSSNTAESAMKLCDTCTGSAFRERVRLLCGNSNHPSSEGTFLISTHAHPVNRSVDRGLAVERGRRPASIDAYRHHLARFEDYLTRIGLK